MHMKHSKPQTSTLTLSAETLRVLNTQDLSRAHGGLICSENPSCQRCDTIEPDCMTTSNTTF